MQNMKEYIKKGENKYNIWIWKITWEYEKTVKHMNVKYEWIYEKGREWTKEINHELLIPQSNYAMIKGENLINQVKEESMKTGREYKMFDMNYISSIF